MVSKVNQKSKRTLNELILEKKVQLINYLKDHSEREAAEELK